jgi:hypothetical protein
MAPASSPRPRVANAPWPRVASLSVLSLVGALGAVAVAALAGASARPELWSAGVARVLAGVLAATGTGASACVTLAALLGPLVAARRLVDGGEAAALEALGWGRAALVRAWIPVAVAAALVAAAAGLGVEPAAWRAVHGLKGSPAAAAAAWARLEGGEVAVLPDGGAVVVRDGALRFRGGDGAWSGVGAAIRPAPAGWDFGPTDAIAADGSRWRADALRLRLDGPAAARWQAAPSSPWAASWGALLARSDEPRARRVLHRRVALVAAVLPLGLLGLCLGWSRRRRDLLGVAVVPLLVFLAARLADASGLPPVLAGWSPTAVATLLAIWAWWRVPA